MRHSWLKRVGTLASLGFDIFWLLSKPIDG